MSVHHDGSVTLAAAIGGHRTGSDSYAHGWQIGSADIECAIADLLALVRATAEITGNNEYGVRIGIEWTRLREPRRNRLPATHQTAAEPAFFRLHRDSERVIPILCGDSSCSATIKRGQIDANLRRVDSASRFCKRAQGKPRTCGPPTRVPATEEPTHADRVMTARDVAELLRLPVSTVYEFARRGVLPSARLGRTVRFVHSDIEAALRRSERPSRS